MKPLENIKVLKKKSILVKNLLKSPVRLRHVNPEIGTENEISDKNIYRPQLALTGFFDLFNFTRVQIFGNTEYYFLEGLDKKKRIEAFKNLCKFDIPCIILTNDHQLDEEMLDIASNRGIAILSTQFTTTKTSFLLSEYLDDQFAPQAVLHGSFVDVYGVGILFVGKSGIGKSEIALDLIERGHRLVADDIVMLTKKRETILMGTGTSMIQHFMEIRGLGIIDIRQMFGVRAIRFQKRLEIIVELEEWNDKAHYTRTGLDEAPLNLLGVDIQTIKLPIFAGKNITVIAETIALNYLLRTYGYDAAQSLTNRLQQNIFAKKNPLSQFEDQRSISWFQGDNE